ncbi:diguanylate cyclase domain-containing protein [Ferrimonas balearica]|uniref:diguanylate cyclase domain-containing protein n=1 Tax=Ferrimonas balearica TaxID=44012 RepID=UPI001C99ED4A|nr:transporter substrate-binding domain-containing protein [Ferrimonas balearica]MBY5991713.1 transporter substrate-binding domain-containing protein [Ferrimonas balearica]
MNALRRPLLLLMLLLGLAVSAQARSDAAESPLIIAVSKDSYPYQFRGPDGDASGYLIELWQRWSVASGRSVRFEVMPWQESLDAVAEGRADIHAGMAYSAERAARFGFTAPVAQIPLKVFVHRSLPKMTDLAELTPYRIGAIVDSVHQELLAAQMTHPTMVTFPDRDSLFDAALAGEVKVFANMDGYLQRSERQQRISRVYPAHHRLPLATIDLVAAVAPGREALIETINTGLGRIGERERGQLARRWLGINDDRGPLLVGVADDLPPLMHLGEQGEAKGLLVDLWRAWSHQSGVAVRFVPSGLGQAGLNALHKGELDVYGAHLAHQVGKLGLDKAYELFRVPSVLLTCSDSTFQPDPPWVGALGVLANVGYEERLALGSASVTLFRSDKPSDLIEMLKEGRVEAVLLPEVMAGAPQPGVVRHPMAQYEVALNVLVATGDQALAERVKRGFAELPAEPILAIQQHWQRPGLGRLSEPLAGALTGPLMPQGGHWPVSLAEVPSWARQSLAVPEALDELSEILGVTLAEEPGSAARPPVALVLRPAPGPLDPVEQPLVSLEYRLIGAGPQPKRISLNTLEGTVAVLNRSPEQAWLAQKHPSVPTKVVRSLEEARNAVHQGARLLVSTAQWQAAQIRDPGLDSALLTDGPQVGLYLDLPASLHGWQGRINLALALLSWQPRLEGPLPSTRPAMAFQVAIWVAAAVILALALALVWVYRNWRWEQLQRSELLRQADQGEGLDPITALPGRQVLDDRLAQAVLRHGREQRQMAVLLLDVDGFGALNRKLGWGGGDALLAQLAQRWSSGLRRSDTLARFDGDQFVVVLNQIQDVGAARHVAQMLLMELETPFRVRGQSVTLTASIGVALFPLHGGDPISLLQAADAQLKRIKGQGGNDYQVA